MDLITSFFGLFSGTIEFEQIKDLFHGALQNDLATWSIKITVVWFLMSGKVKSGLNSMKTEFTGMINAVRNDFTTHFGKVEKGLNDMVSEIKELKENVSTDLGKHSEAIGEMRKDVSQLTVRVDKLEFKKE